MRIRSAGDDASIMRKLLCDRPTVAIAARRFLVGLLVCLNVMGIFVPTVGRADEVAAASYLPSRRAVAAPTGFAGVCDRYEWVCARVAHSGAAATDETHLVRAVNAQINRATHQIADQRQYGTEEYWALPTAAGGDCEDFVLLKKKLLIQQGIAPERLLIATVLDRGRNLHAVLIFRSATGDYVLDNLNDRIELWADTGYSFLEMQNPDSPERWTAVLAGGTFG